MSDKNAVLMSLIMVESHRIAKMKGLSYVDSASTIEARKNVRESLFPDATPEEFNALVRKESLGAIKETVSEDRPEKPAARNGDEAESKKTFRFVDLMEHLGREIKRIPDDNFMDALGKFFGFTDSIARSTRRNLEMRGWVFDRNAFGYSISAPPAPPKSKDIAPDNNRIEKLLEMLIVELRSGRK